MGRRLLRHLRLRRGALSQLPPCADGALQIHRLSADTTPALTLAGLHRHRARQVRGLPARPPAHPVRRVPRRRVLPALLPRPGTENSRNISKPLPFSRPFYAILPPQRYTPHTDSHNLCPHPRIRSSSSERCSSGRTTSTTAPSRRPSTRCSPSPSPRRETGRGRKGERGCVLSVALGTPAPPHFPPATA